jgi:hypothetical protein
MIYSIARNISVSFALCAFSSTAAGNVAFSFLDGDFTPSIASDTITLEQGFEYFIISSPCITAATNYYHIVDGINGDMYSVGARSTNSGLDEQYSSIQADAQVTFSLYADLALTNNSRLQIWRFPL